MKQVWKLRNVVQAVSSIIRLQIARNWIKRQVLAASWRDRVILDFVVVSRVAKPLESLRVVMVVSAAIDDVTRSCHAVLAGRGDFLNVRYDCQNWRSR